MNQAFCEEHGRVPQALGVGCSDALIDIPEECEAAILRPRCLPARNRLEIA
jgi:hypothetical protein